MVENGQLIRCQQRKAALLLRSEECRQELAGEAATLRELATWADLGIGVARSARAGLEIAAPFLAWWHARKKPNPGLIHKLARVLSIARSVRVLWQLWSRTAQPKESADLQKL